MPEQKFLYVAFFSTPFRTGEFIRAVTKYPYNHAAVSLSPEMKYVWSFSRHYKGAPFYAGFTKESLLRYDQNGNIAQIKLCAVPISEENYHRIEKDIEYLEKHRDDTLYNLISAGAFPFRKQIHIKNALTCVEFVLSMLKKYADIPVLKNRDFCTVKELSEALNSYTIFEGSAEKYIRKAEWCGDNFDEKKGFLFYFKNTVSNNAKLIWRFITGKK